MENRVATAAPSLPEEVRRQGLSTRQQSSNIIMIGTLAGLELPLLTRLLKRYGSLRTIIAQAFSFDYVGALAGALLFPLLLLPTLGMMRTAFVVGMLNIGVAAWNVLASSAPCSANNTYPGGAYTIFECSCASTVTSAESRDATYTLGVTRFPSASSAVAR